jgi:hypothetical protein
MNPYYYEVHEGDQNGVRVIVRCGSEEDARMMMGLARPGKFRSWVKCQFLPPDTINTTAEKVDEPHLPPQVILEPNLQEPFQP